jgi:hypothetical protein
MENKLYPNYSIEIQNLKKQETLVQKASPEGDVFKVMQSFEVKELIALAESFSQSAKTAIDPMSSYNTNLKIKELGETTIAKNSTIEDCLRPFVNKASLAVAEAAEKANPEQANSDLFSYYGWISDLQVASDSMMKICNELSTNADLAAAMKMENGGNGKSRSVLEKIKESFNELKERVEKVIEQTANSIGQAGQLLKKELEKAKEFLEKNIVPKFVEAFKKIADLYDAFRLKLFESMFDFVRKVVELAAIKNWKIDSIHVGMPEIGANMADVAGYRIPIPSIKGPPVSFVFKPV